MILRAFLALVLFTALSTSAADKPAAPYTIAVWSDVSFNSEGGVSESPGCSITRTGSPSRKAMRCSPSRAMPTCSCTTTDRR